MKAKRIHKHKVIYCPGCGGNASEPRMGIYSLFDDRYYCDQPCFDAYYGIIRDEDGGVISEGARYKIKQKFREKAGQKILRAVF